MDIAIRYHEREYGQTNSSGFRHGLRLAAHELVRRPEGSPPNILDPHVALKFKVMAFSRFGVRRAPEEVGFPAALVSGAAATGPVVERAPLLRELAGSLLLTATKR